MIYTASAIKILFEDKTGNGTNCTDQDQSKYFNDDSQAWQWC